ncbi:MAG: chemotaxis protein CheB [Asticcacaulis sp.]|nr:chemotaxis protein CheB [Asticcacaulis sp.]
MRKANLPAETPVEIIVIGASAGGVEALSAILPRLPADFAVPVLVVIHLPPDRRSVMAELFDAKCAVSVREADDKEPIERGTVYFAPADYHLLVESDQRMSLSSEEPVLYSRPSIDVLFETAADAYGPTVLGVILSGANEDGAHGLKVIVEGGGQALIQAPETARAAEMPLAARTAVPAAKVLPLDGLAEHLLHLHKVTT